MAGKYHLYLLITFSGWPRFSHGQWSGPLVSGTGRLPPYFPGRRAIFNLYRIPKAFYPSRFAGPLIFSYSRNSLMPIGWLLHRIPGGKLI